MSKRRDKTVAKRRKQHMLVTKQRVGEKAKPPPKRKQPRKPK